MVNEYVNLFMCMKFGFTKMKKETPHNEILLAEKRKADWLRRFK